MIARDRAHQTVHVDDVGVVVVVNGVLWIRCRCQVRGELNRSECGEFKAGESGHHFVGVDDAIIAEGSINALPRACGGRPLGCDTDAGKLSIIDLPSALTLYVALLFITVCPAVGTQGIPGGIR